MTENFEKQNNFYNLWKLSLHKEKIKTTVPDRGFGAYFVRIPRFIVCKRNSYVGRTHRELQGSYTSF